MSDGSKMWGVLATKKRWMVSWEFLSWANVVTIRGLFALNQEQRFKNEFEEDVWYTVIAWTFSYDTLETPEWDKYRVTIELREA